MTAAVATTSKVQSIQDLRRSNAATAIPSRKRRQGDRKSARRAAINDYR